MTLREQVLAYQDQLRGSPAARTTALARLQRFSAAKERLTSEVRLRAPAATARADAAYMIARADPSPEHVQDYEIAVADARVAAGLSRE